MRKEFTKEDDEYLMKNFSMMGINTMASNLHFSHQRVSDRCRKLGLIRKNAEGLAVHRSMVLDRIFDRAVNNLLGGSHEK